MHRWIAVLFLLLGVPAFLIPATNQYRWAYEDQDRNDLTWNYSFSWMGAGATLETNSYKNLQVSTNIFYEGYSCLKFHFHNTNGGWAGGAITTRSNGSGGHPESLQEQDSGKNVSFADYLTFYIKGETNSKARIEIEDSSGNKSSKVELTNFVSIRTNWQYVEIPFSAWTWGSVDLSKVRYVKFMIESYPDTEDFTFYLDAVRFYKKYDLNVSLTVSRTNNVILQWNSPTNYTHTVIVRTNRLLENLSSTNQGTRVYSGTSTVFTDKNLSADAYSYQVFVFTNLAVPARQLKSMIIKNCLIDDFADGNALSGIKWAQWTNELWGASGNGTGSQIFNAAGITDNAMRFNFNTDTGAWGGANAFLVFSNTRNLNELNARALSFYIKGRTDMNFYLQIETSLGGGQYYRCNLEIPSSNSWTSYNIGFADFTGTTVPMPFSLARALSNCTGLKWECPTPAFSGTFSLDMVRFQNFGESYSLPGMSVTSFAASALPEGIQLVWINPSSTNFGSVRILRKTGQSLSFSSTNDGLLIYTGKGTSYLDTISLENKEYYQYAVFVMDRNNKPYGPFLSNTVLFRQASREAFMANNLYDIKKDPDKRPKLVLKLSEDEAQKVVVRIYNVNGHLISTLVDRYLTRGIYEQEWDMKDLKGRDVPAGVYLVKINIKDKITVQKIVLIR